MREPLLAGFTTIRRGRATLIARETLVAALVEAAFDEEPAWETKLASARGSGRGGSATATVRGVKLRLKRMRRGGLAGPLWRDRFLGKRRLLRNLSVPLEAVRRGVSTPLPLALLVVAGPPGLNRAWLATEEVRGTEDLRQLSAGACRPDPARLAAALAVVRLMHDVGVEHRDLNLANLLVSAGGTPRAWVVDLDRARLHTGPLGLGLRRVALARLERSWAKSAPASFGPGVRVQVAELYAAGDRELVDALARRPRVNRCRIALHRLGWRR